MRQQRARSAHPDRPATRLTLRPARARRAKGLRVRVGGRDPPPALAACLPSVSRPRWPLSTPRAVATSTWRSCAAPSRPRRRRSPSSCRAGCGRSTGAGAASCISSASRCAAAPALSALVIDEARRKGRLFLPEGRPSRCTTPSTSCCSSTTWPATAGWRSTPAAWPGRAALSLLRPVRGGQDDDGPPVAPPSPARRRAQRRPHDRARARRAPVGVRHSLARLRPLRLTARPAPRRDLLPRPRPPGRGGTDGSARWPRPSSRASFPPPWEAAGSTRVLDLCARVAGEVPCARLRFRPDQSAVAAGSRRGRGRLRAEGPMAIVDRRAFVRVPRERWPPPPPTAGVTGRRLPARPPRSRKPPAGRGAWTPASRSG